MLNCKAGIGSLVEAHLHISIPMKTVKEERKIGLLREGAYPLPCPIRSVTSRGLRCCEVTGGSEAQDAAVAENEVDPWLLGKQQTQKASDSISLFCFVLNCNVRKVGSIWLWRVSLAGPNWSLHLPVTAGHPWAPAWPWVSLPLLIGSKGPGKGVTEVPSGPSNLDSSSWKPSR